MSPDKHTRKPRKSSRTTQKQNHQFPGIVIPISSVPRLRVGSICEMHSCTRCVENNGLLVVIEEMLPDGNAMVRALREPLQTYDPETGNFSAHKEWRSVTSSKNLYRIGTLEGRRQ
jgi:hypothetical protein